MKRKTKTQLEVELQMAKARIAHLEQIVTLTEKIKDEAASRGLYYRSLSDRLLSIMEAGAKEGKFPR